MCLYDNIVLMIGLDKLENAEWLELFSEQTTYHTNYSLFKALTTDELVERLWNKCSNLYCFSVFPSDEKIEEWVDIPEIYRILKRAQPGADWNYIHILIWKFEDSVIEECRQQAKESKEINGEYIRDPREPEYYVCMIWLYWYSRWRCVPIVIKELKNKFPEKIKELKHK